MAARGVGVEREWADGMLAGLGVFALAGAVVGFVDVLVEFVASLLVEVGG
ncbi:MAG: hypothetical protein ACXWQ5_16670 [Ktedonobacterales bacterium]